MSKFFHMVDETICDIDDKNTLESGYDNDEFLKSASTVLLAESVHYMAVLER
jgi:hypothetical protein